MSTSFNSTKYANGGTYQSYIVNDKPPSMISVLDPSTGNWVWTGAWRPGEFHRVSTTTPERVLALVERRASGVTPGFGKGLTLIQPLGFVYGKTVYKNSYNLRVYSTRDQPGTAGYQDTSVFSDVSGGPGTQGQSLEDSVIAALDARLLLKLTTALKDSSINMAQAVAERKQTCDLLAGTAKQIASSFAHLRKGDIAGAARDLGIVTPKRAGRRFKKSYAEDQAKALSSGWLALQYGWKPLLSDVYGAAEHLAKSHNNIIFKRQQVRGTVAHDKYTRRDDLTSAMKGVNYRAWQDKDSVTIRYGVCYSASSPTIANLAQLGITNPALLAWELVPYSFVADWFLPIGNWLATLDATLGLQFLSGYKTVFRRWSSEGVQVKAYSIDSTGVQFNGFGSSSEVGVSCRRTTLSGFPSVPFPNFKNPFSTSHVTSAMSLLFQTFKR